MNNLVSFNSEETQASKSERDLFSLYKRNSGQKGEIIEGMSPKEIADVVSDHLMDVIKEQFEKAKIAFQQSQH